MIQNRNFVVGVVLAVIKCGAESADGPVDFCGKHEDVLKYVLHFGPEDKSLEVQVASLFGILDYAVSHDASIVSTIPELHALKLVASESVKQFRDDKEALDAIEGSKAALASLGDFFSSVDEEEDEE